MERLPQSHQDISQKQLVPEIVKTIPEHVVQHINDYEEARSYFVDCKKGFQEGTLTQEQFAVAHGRLISTQIAAIGSPDFEYGTQGDKKPGLFFVKEGAITLEEYFLAISSDSTKKEQIVEIRLKIDALFGNIIKSQKETIPSSVPSIPEASTEEKEADEWVKGYRRTKVFSESEFVISPKNPNNILLKQTLGIGDAPVFPVAPDKFRELLKSPDGLNFEEGSFQVMPDDVPISKERTKPNSGYVILVADKEYTVDEPHELNKIIRYYYDDNRKLHIEVFEPNPRDETPQPSPTTPAAVEESKEASSPVKEDQASFRQQLGDRIKNLIKEESDLSKSSDSSNQEKLMTVRKELRDLREEAMKKSQRFAEMSRPTIPNKTKQSVPSTAQSEVIVPSDSSSAEPAVIEAKRIESNRVEKAPKSQDNRAVAYVENGTSALSIHPRANVYIVASASSREESQKLAANMLNAAGDRKVRYPDISNPVSSVIILGNHLSVIYAQNGGAYIITGDSHRIISAREIAGNNKTRDFRGEIKASDYVLLSSKQISRETILKCVTGEGSVADAVRKLQVISNEEGEKNLSMVLIGPQEKQAEIVKSKPLENAGAIAITQQQEAVVATDLPAASEDTKTPEEAVQAEPEPKLKQVDIVQEILETAKEELGDFDQERLTTALLQAHMAGLSNEEIRLAYYKPNVTLDDVIGALDQAVQAKTSSTPSNMRQEVYHQRTLPKEEKQPYHGVNTQPAGNILKF